MIEEVKKTAEETLRLFEEFKKRNNKEMEDVKKGKYVPQDILDTNDKHNKAIDSLQEKVENLTKAINRETVAGKDDPQAFENEAKAVAKKWFHTGTLNAEEYKTLGKSLVDSKGNIYASEKELKQLNVGTDSEGGYFVRPQWANEIIKRNYETSPIRQHASVMSISTSELHMVRVNDESAASWVGEQGTRSNTDEVDIGKLIIPVHEMYAMPRATQAILDDASIDVEAWHAQMTAEYMGRLEATAFATGDGVDKPRGISTYTDGTTVTTVEQVNSGSAGAFTADGLIDCQNALHEPFQKNARWMMQRASAGSIRKLQDGNGNYLWSMDKGLNEGPMDYLLGRPVHFANDVAAIASAALAAYYGDFKQGYQIVDRVGIRVLRDVYSSKPYVLFYTTKRVGGAVKNGQALKLQLLSA